MKVLSCNLSEIPSTIEALFTQIHHLHPDVVCVFGCLDRMYEGMFKEFRKDGYSLEKLGGVASTSYSSTAQTYNSFHIFTRDDWCTRIYKNYKRFLRTNENSGFVHYTLHLKDSGESINLIAVSFDGEYSVKKTQLAELETYTANLERCVVVAECDLRTWQEPPLFVPKGMCDMWREWGNADNAFIKGDLRCDRVWCSPLLFKNHAFDVVNHSVHNHKMIWVSLE